MLVNLYTLLSDVSKGADDLHKTVTDVLLEWLHHDQPVVQYSPPDENPRYR